MEGVPLQMYEDLLGISCVALSIMVEENPPHGNDAPDYKERKLIPAAAADFTNIGLLR